MYFQDLDEDVVITLTAKNPQAPQNIIRFDHTTGEFVTIKLAESMIDHLEIESTSILRDSEEGKKQLQTSGEVKKESKLLFIHDGKYLPSIVHFYIERDPIIYFIEARFLNGTFP